MNYSVLFILASCSPAYLIGKFIYFFRIVSHLPSDEVSTETKFCVNLEEFVFIFSNSGIIGSFVDLCKSIYNGFFKFKTWEFWLFGRFEEVAIIKPENVLSRDQFYLIDFINQTYLYRTSTPHS